MKQPNKRPRIVTNIYAYDIAKDTYSIVIPPFNAQKHLVYIRAANKKDARLKIENKFNEFMVNKGLNDRS